MIVYHNSPHKFEFPVYEDIVKNRTNHENGELGLWFSTTNNWQKGFGSYCYEIEIQGVPMHIDICDFVMMCRDDNTPDYYKKWRDEWMSKYKTSYIAIIETSGCVDMGIILNFDCIKSFTLISE